MASCFFLADQTGGGTERVEDEMRFYLQSQGGQLRLRQQSGKAGAGRMLMQQAVVRVQRHAERRDGAIQQRVEQRDRRPGTAIPGR